MRMYWSVGLPGPFRVGGPVGRRKARRPRAQLHFGQTFGTILALISMAAILTGGVMFFFHPLLAWSLLVVGVTFLYKTLMAMAPKKT